MAILGGRTLASIMGGDDAGARRFARLNGGLLLFLAAAGVVYPLMMDIPVLVLYPYTLPASVSLGVLALHGWKLAESPPATRSKMTVTFCLLAFANALLFARGFTLEERFLSHKEPAAVIRERLRPEDVVAGYGNTMQGLGFYLGRRIVLADAVGELEFGARQERDPRWFIGQKELKVLWEGEERVFLAVNGQKMEELEQLLRKSTIKSTIIWLDKIRNDFVLLNQGEGP